MADLPLHRGAPTTGPLSLVNLHFIGDSRSGKGNSGGDFSPTDLNLITRAEALARFGALQEAIRAVGSEGSKSWYATWSGTPEFERVAILREAEPAERATMIKNLLPLTHSSTEAGEAILKILEASRTLSDAHTVVAAVGAEKLALSPRSAIFAEQLFLIELWPRIQGVERLPSPNIQLSEARAREGLDEIAIRLRANVELFYKATLEQNQIPQVACANAGILFDQFRRSYQELPLTPELDEPDVQSHHPDSEAMEDLMQAARKVLGSQEGASADQQSQGDFEARFITASELYSRWYHKLAAFKTTGLGLIDSTSQRWEGDIARETAQALQLYPDSIYFFHGVALNLIRAAQPEGRPSVGGGTLLGKVYLYDVGASTGRAPDAVNHSVAARTILHEVAHCCHTYCHSEFRHLSGWDFLRDSEFRMVGDSAIFYRGKVLQSGDELERDGEKCILSLEDKGVWIHRSGARFVNDYAAVSPFEDYAESLTMYILNPLALKVAAPEKFRFMRYLYGGELE